MGVKLTGHIIGDYNEPDCWMYDVRSDISNKPLDEDEDEFWIIDDLICSKEEMIEYFKENYTWKVEDEEEYKQAKKFLIEFYDYKEEDFKNHPCLYKVNKAVCSSDFGLGVIPFMTEKMFKNGDLNDFLGANISGPLDLYDLAPSAIN